MQKTLFYMLIGLFGFSLMFIASGIAQGLSVVAGVIYLMGFILLLLCHHLLFHLLFSEQMIDIIVTDKRIIYFNDSLFTCDDEHEIPLTKVAGVEVQQHGIIPNFLNYGILWFDTGGGSVDLKRSIPHVPKPDELAQIINAQLRST